MEKATTEIETKKAEVTNTPTNIPNPENTATATPKSITQTPTKTPSPPISTHTQIITQTLIWTPTIAAIPTTTLVASAPSSKGKIAYVHRGPDGGIYVMNSDGTDKTKIFGSGEDFSGLSWSPDGKQITYSSDQDGVYNIYVMNADGSYKRKLVDVSLHAVYPAWSPDGETIAFEYYKSRYDPWIVIVNADGDEWSEITQGENPSWSPDGLRIVFQRASSSQRDLFIVNLADGEVNQLTNSAQSEEEPSWSPDGQRIAFRSYPDNTIYLIDPDGSNVVGLTTEASNPTWSPNSQQIAFNSSRDSNWGIHTINFDGSEQIKLTDHPAGDGQPAWVP